MYALTRPLALIAAAASALAIAAGAGATATPALASRGQTTYFEAPNDLLDAQLRPGALRQLESLGVHALRIVMYWQDVAPDGNSASVPGVDLADPASYDWGQYADVIAAAHALHWSILLDVSGPGPRWAMAGHRDHVTRPSQLYFGRLMTAVARQFGSDVSLYAIWNEPNHPFFLMPQFNRNRTPASPRIYRGLWQAGYAGLQAAGIRRPRVLMGDTAPTGYERTRGAHDVAPITFLRGALCLDNRWRRSRTCGKLPIYGWAHHAYSTPAGPYSAPSDRNDVTIGSLGRLTSALDRAGRAHAIPRGAPIFLTEFGWQSKPNRFLGVSPHLQAVYNAVSEHIAYDNPRVWAFSQYLLRDDPIGGRPGSGVHGGYVGFQTGLEYVNGRHKPSYDGFRLPLTVKPARGGYDLWGLVRPATGATDVQVMVLNRHSRRWRTLYRSIRTDRLGYWHKRTHDSAGRLFQVRWRAPDGTRYSGAVMTPFR